MANCIPHGLPITITVAIYKPVIGTTFSFGSSLPPSHVDTVTRKDCCKLCYVDHLIDEWFKHSETRVYFQGSPYVMPGQMYAISGMWKP